MNPESLNQMDAPVALAAGLMAQYGSLELRVSVWLAGCDYHGL
jgi:hypothetical protein